MLCEACINLPAFLGLQHAMLCLTLQSNWRFLKVTCAKVGHINVL